jgi:uncharacterized protein
MPPRKQPFEVRPSSVQGLGAFATRRIRKGARVAEYTGERIPTSVADTRYDDDAMARHHTFLFSVDDDMVIDAAVNGGDARFINHSCDPNCEAVQVGRRIFIEALRDIPEGAELFYDYSLERDQPVRKAWLKLYACKCGAARCRGTMLKLPPAKRPAAKKASAKKAGAKKSPRTGARA